MKAAREISEDEESASKGGYVGEVDSSFKGLAHILNRLEENQVSRAVNSNEGVFLVFADKITPIPPVFMEIQEKVKNAYTIYMKEKIRKQIIEDTLEKANFKLVESAPVAS